MGNGFKKDGKFRPTAKKNGGVSSKDTRTRKAIQTEIWKAKGENVFGGKDLILFINRSTGKLEEYQKISESTNSNLTWDANIKGEGVSPEEMYGANGYRRLRFGEQTINHQNDIPDEDDKLE